MAITATQMIAALEEALTKNIGLKSISVDGQTFTFADRQALLDELNVWKQIADREAGTKKRFRTIDIS